MNKSKLVLSIILVLVFYEILILPIHLFSQEINPTWQGDLRINNQSYSQTINVKIEVGESLCFEGINQEYPGNRLYQIQNGSTFRKYMTTNSTYIANANDNGKYGVYIPPRTSVAYRQNSTQVDLSVNFSYGYSKYKITISTDPYNPQTISHMFYLNTTDSKYQKISEFPYNDYGMDIQLYYLNANSSINLFCNSENNPNFNIPIYNPNSSIPERKVWEICPDPPFPLSQPASNKFYVRSTPFGMRPDIEGTYRANVFINEELIFDFVENTSNTTYYGYNTVDGFYRSPDIPNECYDQFNTYMTPSILFYGEGGDNIGTNFEFNSGSIFDLGGLNGGNKKMWISSDNLDPTFSNDKFTFKEGSKIILRPNSIVHTYKLGKLKDEGSIKELSAGSMFRAWDHSLMEFTGNNKIHTFNNGFKMVIDGGGTLKVGENTTLVFDGLSNGPNLKLDPNAIVQLGTNAKIVFKNGAYLDANGATFSGDNGATWQGIVFEQSNLQHIRYCTFSNALTSLKFLYDPRNEVIAPYIHDNTFNIVPSSSTFGIYSEDMNFATIGSNTFNMSGNYSVGIFMKTSAGIIPSSESDIYYKLLLYDNKFNGGFAGLYLASYASDLKPYFLYGNKFNVNSNNIGNFGIIGKKITGEVKNCVFSSTKTNCDISVVQSSLRLTNNNLGAINENISAYTNSTIGIAPNVASNEIILTGGYNTFYSSSSDNFNLRANQNLYLNNGYNCFTGHGSGKLHLLGYLNISGTTYDAYNNYWNTSAPNYLLFNNNQPPQSITLNWSQSSACKGFALSVDQIIDRGNGIFDTVYKFQNSTYVAIQPDEYMYNQAFSYLNISNFPSAILNFKTLIDDYPTSMFLSGALYDLYTSYECLDTSSNQSFKDNLYSDLKTYLTAKINSNNYDAQFCDIAYNLILMCEANMQNYNDALTGYQFISLYHPDAIARLMASWDYVEIEEFMNGMGGGDNENISEEKYVLDLTKRLEVSISRDSTMKNLKRQYVKEAEQNNSKMKTDLGSKSMITKKTAIEKKTKDDMLIRKSVEVLMSSKSLTKEQKSKKQMEDIILITKNDKEDISNDSRNIIPNEYTLSQNYPNPFNPVTKINFALPKQGFVSLKIYDITGREIQTLVNDVKQAGYYTVDFNGSSLASGVYFYMIKSGDFVMTKRMVLVK